MSGLSEARSLATVAAGLFVVGALVSSPRSGAASSAPKQRSPRRVVVEMLAISFQPKSVRVSAHETVVFHFVNNDVAPHDAFFGNADRQLDRERAVDALLSAGGDLASLQAPKVGYVLVKAKSTRDVPHTFGQPGRLLIGCHQPGHWDSGMKINVIVGP